MSKVKVKRESFLKKITPYMGNKRVFIPISIIFSSISAILNIIPFYYIWKISKEILVSDSNISIDNVKRCALMLFLSVILGILSYFLALMFSHLAAFELEAEIKKKGFEKLMNMPLGFFNVHSSGKIKKVINDGAEEGHSFLAHELPNMASTVLTPLIILIIFFSFDWRLGLAALVPIILAFLMMSLMLTKEGKDYQKKYTDALEVMNSEAVEYVRSIPVVKTFGQSIRSFTRFYNSIENYKNLVIASTKMAEKPYSLYLVFIETTALFLIPISILIIKNNGNIANTISNFILYVLIAPQLSIVMLKSVYFKYQQFVAEQSIDRFNALFDYEQLEYPKKGVELNGNDLEFRNVSFSYNGEQKVLDNISFKVKMGETLALVGTSGSGKTTIARLAARFWDVSFGEVLIGGKNIKNYDEETLMNNISFVFQNTELFDTTIKDNICFGRKVSDEILQKALIRSRSKEIIENLEAGLLTVIGTKGIYLSGGEKQRISLARAFIKDAPIVLLDEATAFADPENEHLIQASFKDLSRGKTTIIIAHRMTTIKDVDNIAVIDKGRIVEYGSHKLLIEKNGLYKKMWDEYQQSIEWKIKKET